LTVQVTLLESHVDGVPEQAASVVTTQVGTGTSAAQPPVKLIVSDVTVSVDQPPDVVAKSSKMSGKLVVESSAIVGSLQTWTLKSVVH